MLVIKVGLLFVYSSMKKNQWNEKGIGWFLTKKNYFEGQNSAALELQF